MVFGGPLVVLNEHGSCFTILHSSGELSVVLRGTEPVGLRGLNNPYTIRQPAGEGVEIQASVNEERVAGVVVSCLRSGAGRVKSVTRHRRRRSG
jgi:hypothetical protein